jgi:hypothetical protein
VHGSRPLSFQNIYEDLTAHMLRIRRNSQWTFSRELSAYSMKESRIKMTVD